MRAQVFGLLVKTHSTNKTLYPQKKDEHQQVPITPFPVDLRSLGKGYGKNQSWGLKQALRTREAVHTRWTNHKREFSLFMLPVDGVLRLWLCIDQSASGMTRMVLLSPVVPLRSWSPSSRSSAYLALMGLRCISSLRHRLHSPVVNPRNYLSHLFCSGGGQYKSEWVLLKEFYRLDIPLPYSFSIPWITRLSL